MYINVKEYRNKLLISELNQDYQMKFRTDDFQPELFVPSFDEHTEYKSLITGECLDKLTFDDIREFKEYKYQNKEVGNSDLHGVVDAEYQYIRATYKNQQKVKSRFWYLDIETGVPDNGFPNAEEAESPITLIQIAESDTKTKYILAYLNVLNYDREDVQYLKCQNEVDMMNTFVKFLHLRTPAVTVAWNGDQFDFPYIVNRMTRIGLNPELLSPFKELEDHRAVMFGKDIKIKKPVGYVWLDYIDCFKKAIPGGQESWSLENISKVILGEDIGGKMNYQKYGYKDMKAFILNKWNKNNCQIIDYNASKDEHWKLFVDYGIIDVEILIQMDNKLGILNMLVNMAHTMGINIYDTFATIKPWQVHLYDYMYENNNFVPNKSPFETYHTVGGHVYANPGLHKWVISEDYTSLYPFCIMSLNLSPETYLFDMDVPSDLKELTKSFYRYADNENSIYCEDIYLALPEEHKNQIATLLQKYNLAMAPNGTFYKRDFQGVLPERVKSIFLSRKAYKKEMIQHQKNAEKLKAEITRRGLKV